MNPAQSVPLTVANGLETPLPGVPQRALASTRARITRATIQKSVPLRGRAGGLWLAAPMKRSSGIDSTTLVREARPPRAPAGAAAGFAGRPAPVSMAFWITIL